MINKDYERTFPELGLFTEPSDSGKNKLYNVLKAYCCYDYSIGYVQGMNYLAALLLIYIKDEVKAFWCFVYLMHRKNWREVYNHNTPKLHSLLNLVQERLQKEDPVLLNHLLRYDLEMAAAFSPLFITLYIYRIPIKDATRIFEAFILDGELALIKILFKMLEHKRDKLLSLKDDLLDFLRTHMIVECIEELSIDQLLNY